MTKREKQIQKRLEWNRQQSRDIELAKAELAAKHGLERNAKFDRAWDIAWDNGHSSGIQEVKYFFDELVDLIKPD